MNKMIYFRPDDSNAELLTADDVKRIHRAWGNKNPYNKIEHREEDHNYGTGLHWITELFATIQCNRHLNERQQQLQERIASKKKLTYSKSRSFEFVEQNMLFKLLYDAKDLYIKEGGYHDDMKIQFTEASRLYNLPYKSIMGKVQADEKIVGDIPEPKTLHDIKYDISYDGDQQSTYKFYYVKGTLTKRGNFIKTGLPYCGKVYQSYDKNYIQIYVHDYYGRNWGLQNVVDYLLRHNMIELK